MHKKQIRPLARLHGYWLARRWLAPMARWPLEERRRWVFQRLKRTLVRAFEGVPFYRERFRQAGFDPERDFRTTGDLERVPILTKADVRENHDRLIDRRFLLGSVEAHTSGTSGQPTALRLNERYVAIDYAVMYRHWAQAGYRFRDRYAAVRSYVPSKPGDPLWKFNRAENTLYMSAYHLRPSNGAAYVDALLEFQPQYLRGYPSSLAVLAEIAAPQREKFSFLRGVFTASEMLSAHERAGIERTFGKKLFDWYGMTEPAVVITERADHSGLEAVWEYGYPEFLEGAHLSGGQRRLVATGFHNPVMPFIRYETEDLATLSGDVDSAGMHPRVIAMAGRKDEYILTPDGGRLPSLNFYSLLQTYTDILRFQFVQTSLNRLEMRVALRPGASDVDAMLGKVREEVRHRVGELMELEVEMTDQFMKSPDGKTPAFKRAFTPESGTNPSAAEAGH